MVPLSILDLVPVIVGETPRDALRKDLESFVALTKADELMVVCSIYDHAARIRSYEIVAEIARAR